MTSLLRSENKFALYNILLRTKFDISVVPDILVDISYFDLRYPVKVNTITLKLYDYDIRKGLNSFKYKESRFQKIFLNKFLNYLDGLDLPGSAFSLDRFSMLTFADYLIDFDYDKTYSCLRLKFQEVARPLC